MTDKRLIQECRRGDREAQRELFNRTIDSVYRLLLRMTGCADDAFDLAQETYLRAFAALGEFRGGSTLRTWLYRIAVNEALQLNRRRDVSLRYQLTQARENSHAGATDDSAMRRLDVNEALAAMEAGDRAILLLRYDQGLSYHQIADVLICEEGTVASRLSRARAKLRERLGEGYSSMEESDRAVHPIRGEGGSEGAESLTQSGVWGHAPLQSGDA